MSDYLKITVNGQSLEVDGNGIAMSDKAGETYSRSTLEDPLSAAEGELLATLFDNAARIVSASSALGLRLS